MSEACIKKLSSEWEHCSGAKDWGNCAKILRATINVLKCTDGLLSDHKGELTEKIVALESQLGEMSIDESLLVIGHIRYARKTIAISSGEFGAGFATKLSKEERARIRKRNRSPKLGLQNRAQLGPDYAVGPPSSSLQPHVLGNGEDRLAQGGIDSDF